MIKISEHEEELLIKYNNQIIIKHSFKTPAFFVGNGKESIENYRGNFTITDSIIKKTALTEFSINDESIVFSNEGLELKVSFTEKKSRLHINFHTENKVNRFWVRLYATEKEKVYGCGAQASYFNLRGKNVPLWTSESGVGRDASSKTKYYADLYDKAGGSNFTTYYPETTYVSTQKYWLHLNTFAYSEFDFTNNDFHEFHVWEIPDEMIISYKPTYLDLIEDLTDYTGRPKKLPDFLLDGMILGVQGGMAQVKKYLKSAKDNNVRVNGLWCQDWAGIKYTTFGKRLFWNWKLNEEFYPDLENEIINLNKDNIEFLTYICPFLLEDESLFNEAKALDLLVYNQQGGIYKVDFGEFYCGIVDLTNPKAFEWYKNVIKTNILDLGIKGWMADFGEYLPTDCVLHNKRHAVLMHNEWPVLWAKCNYEAVKESNKQEEVFYFMRAGGFGSQKYAASLWAGDQSVNWELHDGIASVIPLALSTGIIGNPYIHSDIGGYTSLYGNIRTKELFDRWLEMSVFSAFMRTHEGNRPAENFQFYNNEDTLKLMSRMTSIRYDLKPYTKDLILEGSTKGYPVQRALFLHYENDLNTYDIQYSFLFGKDILVSPVIEPGIEEKEVYLPDDEWIHLWTGKKYLGSNKVKIKCPIGYPPVFYRSKSKYHNLFESITQKYHY